MWMQVLLQCGCKYGFSQEIDASVRTTQLHLFSKEDLAGLPTNNIPSEHVLSVFDWKATAAKCRNKLFKAKSIRNDMILHQSSQRIPEQKVKQIMKVSAKCEKIGVLHKKNCTRRKSLKNCAKQAINLFTPQNYSNNGLVQ